jgi:hypothetical protein
MLAVSQGKDEEVGELVLDVANGIQQRGAVLESDENN